MTKRNEVECRKSVSICRKTETKLLLLCSAFQLVYRDQCGPSPVKAVDQLGSVERKIVGYRKASTRKC